MRLSLVPCLIVTLLCASCQTLPPRSSEVDAFRDTIPWQRSQVEGLNVTLIDPHYYEHLTFEENGALVVTAGSGGKICAPLWGWRLCKGRLFTCDAGGRKLGSEYHLVSLTDEVLTLRKSDGKLRRYKVNHRSPTTPSR